MDTKETGGLITLTEERLREILIETWSAGWNDGTGEYSDGKHEHASRIIEGLKKEGA